MSSLLLFHGVYRLEIQSVMLVFSIQLFCELLPLYPSLWFTSPLSPSSRSPSTVNTDSVWLGGGGVGELSCVGDHILQELNTLFLTRSEPTKLL
jgi:hypothetical protein